MAADTDSARVIFDLGPLGGPYNMSLVETQEWLERQSAA